MKNSESVAVPIGCRYLYEDTICFKSHTESKYYMKRNPVKFRSFYLTIVMSLHDFMKLCLLCDTYVGRVTSPIINSVIWNINFFFNRFHITDITLHTILFYIGILFCIRIVIFIHIIGLFMMYLDQYILSSSQKCLCWRTSTVESISFSYRWPFSNYYPVTYLYKVNNL